MGFKKCVSHTIFLIIGGVFLSPFNTFAGTLTNVSVVGDSYIPSATTRYVISYTTANDISAGFPNDVLFLSFNADLAGNFSFDGANVGVTVNGVSKSVFTFAPSGFVFQIILNSAVPAGSNVVVTVNNVVNPNHAGSFGFSNFSTTNSLTSGIIDSANPSPVIIAVPDTTPPTLSQTTAVTTPTNTHTPSYTFTTNEAGTITYGGSCSSATTSATIGANTITFTTLADGTYSNCTITVTDAASNVSMPLSVSAFTVDTVAPVLTEMQPIPTRTNTADAIYHFKTNETCTPVAGPPSASPVSAVSTVIDNTTTPGTNYTARLSGIQLGGTYSVDFQCRDAAGNLSNTLHVGPFTVIGVSGGLGLPAISTIPITPVVNTPVTTVSVIENRTTDNKNSITPGVTNLVLKSAPEEEAPPVVVKKDVLVPKKIKYTFTTDITPRRINNSRDVAMLQAFLNHHEGESLKINGIYNTQTEAAVKRFQIKYSHEILDPWKITYATGNVAIYTRKKINALILENDI